MDLSNYYKENYNAYIITILFKESCDFPSIIIVDIYRELIQSEDQLEILTTKPSIFETQVDGDHITRNYQFHIATKNNQDLLKLILKNKLLPFKEYIEKLSITLYTENFIEERKLPEKPIINIEAQESNISVSKSIQKESIRLDLDKAEDLGNMVGELISIKIQIDTYVAKIVSENKSLKGDYDKLKTANKQLGIVTNNLRDLSLGIRMLPVSTLFRKYPKIVRDLSKQFNKNIELNLIGQDTKLDKSLIEEINDPLTHLIRNAIDHGIESPQERIAKNKPETAQINMRAYNDGNGIVIEVEDDGRGIDYNKIRQKIIDKGLSSEESLNHLSEQDILLYIFEPGFSTAQSVSNISGRGVGLDVVKTNIEHLNGSVEVQAISDIGTKFILKLPLTLSIIQVLLVREEGLIYAIPFSSIIETTIIHRDILQSLGDYYVIEKNNSALPVFRLAELYKQPYDNNKNDLYLIELSVSSGQFGILVDDVIGSQEIVIKTLGSYLGKVKGIGGGTILSDGNVTLVSDVKALSDIVKEFIRSDNLKINKDMLNLVK